MPRPSIKDRNNNTGLVGLGPIPSQAPVASFNADQFESLIKTKGFLGFHYKMAFLPDRESFGSPPSPISQGAFQSGLYYDVRPIYLVPQSIRLEERLQVSGIYGMGSVLLNVSGKYYDNRPDPQVQIEYQDLIVLNPTITKSYRQMFEYNPTGPQTLNYKIKGIEILFDNEREYEEGKDFAVQNGEIVWLQGGLRPSFKDGKGAALSIRYFATPVYVVMDLPHHLRIIPSNDVGHGALPRDAEYAPQLVVAKSLTSVQVSNIINWKDLPPLPDYPASSNTTGGSF